MTEVDATAATNSTIAACALIAVISSILEVSSLVRSKMLWSLVVGVFGAALTIIMSVNFHEVDGQTGLAIPMFFIFFFLSALVGTYIGRFFKHILGTKV